MRDLLEQGGVVCGIDPGQHTGLIAVHVPATLELQGVRYITSRVLELSTAGAFSSAQRDNELGFRIAFALSVVKAEHVALEEPADAKVAWRGQKKQQTGTAFRLGAYYGQACAAAGQCDTVREIVSYPVTKYGKRAGWMRGQPRERILAIVSQTLRAIGAPLDELSEHEQMAFGVVMHHIAEITAARYCDVVQAIKDRGAAPLPATRRRRAPA